MRFFEEARVVKKTNAILPPRPIKKEKEEAVTLLEEKESAPAPALKKRVPSNMNKSANRPETNSYEREK